MIVGRCHICGAQLVDLDGVPDIDGLAKLYCDKCCELVTVEAKITQDTQQPKTLENQFNVGNIVVVLNEQLPWYGQEAEVIAKDHIFCRVKCGERLLWLPMDQISKLSL